MVKVFNDASGYDVEDLGAETVEEAAFTSAWISHAQRDMKSGRTNVTFRDNYTWVGSMSEDEWYSFLSSPSKGKWWHSEIMRR